MKDLSITRSILSISSPGVYFKAGDYISSQKLARQVNEFAGDLVRRQPKEFGFWASLPLPDVASTLEEIPFALDTLKADGIALQTNYYGTYIGDSAFDAVFEELNRRKATVFIHPTTPCMKHQDGSIHTAITVLPQFPNPMFEFMFDSSRALISLFLSGTVARCPNITFIIPHAGATLPPIIERFTSFASLIGGDRNLTSQVIKDTFAKQFYFDLAGFPFPDQIWGLFRHVGVDRLLYGSDYPFTPNAVVKMLAERMAIEMKSWSEEERKAVRVGNARRLLEKAK